MEGRIKGGGMEGGKDERRMNVWTEGNRQGRKAVFMGCFRVTVRKFY